jgi:fructose/tagatose bisphosphate aldolase
MVDGSRLPVDENIAATRQAVTMAHQAGIPCEAELGAVMGHEAGPLPPYNELFKSGRGFTKVDEARRFVVETGCDWLSVAIGNIHGAISEGFRNQKKIAARLNLEHLESLFQATSVQAFPGNTCWHPSKKGLPKSISVLKFARLMRPTCSLRAKYLLPRMPFMSALAG